MDMVRILLCCDIWFIVFCNSSIHESLFVYGLGKSQRIVEIIMKRFLKKWVLRALFGCINQEKLLSTLLKINYCAGADITSGGEAKAMRYLHQVLLKKYPDCQYELFDVGANIGNYSIELNKEFGKKAKIEAFEPLNSTFRQLLDHVKSSREIVCHNVGFSDQKVSLPVYTSTNRSTLA